MRKTAISIFFLTIFSSLPCFCQNYGKMSQWIRKTIRDIEVSEKQRNDEYQRCSGSSEMTRQSDNSEKYENAIMTRGLKQSPDITVIIRCDTEEILRENGCYILASWGDKHIVRTKVSQLKKLSEISEVKRIEAGKPCAITNDLSADMTHVTETKNDITLPDGKKLTGEGIIVGVMDIGFDLTHPTFWSNDMGRYRIKALWDQLDFSSEGSEVTGKDTVYVGREYTSQTELINKWTSFDAELCTHGTHTSATAAGSGSEGNALGQYSGMAPEAELCLVANFTSDNMSLVSEENILLYNTATDLLGFKYLFDYAEKVGKPCVINFSEGSKDNFFDTQLYSEILCEMLGKGRIICSAAGNEALKNTYIHKEKGKEKAGAFITNSSKEALYTFSSDLPPVFTLSFYDNTGKPQQRTYDVSEIIHVEDSICSDTIDIDESRYIIYFTAYKSCYDERKWATELMVTDTLKTISGSNISLTLLDEKNDIECYSISGEFKSNVLDETLSDFSNDHNILLPGCIKDVICVGATAYRTDIVNMHGTQLHVEYGSNGSHASFSSKGPTLSGQIKPDVMAPGQFIVSAYGSKYYAANETLYPKRWNIKDFTYNGRKYLWSVSNGTSMSCPIVTGIIALWLQVCPTLSPEDILDVIAHTSSHYDDSLEYPNNIYGYGEINALEGVKYIQKVYTGIENVFQEEAISTGGYYDLSGRKISNASEPGIYITSSGKKIIRY